MSAGTPECCGSASCAERERSPPAHGDDRPATQVKREKAPEVAPRGPPTASAVVSASSDSSSTGWKSLGRGLKVAPGCVRLLPAPLHHLPSASNNIWGKRNPRQVLRFALNLERTHKWGPDPPFSPAGGVKVHQYAYPPLWSSPPWMLQLQVTSSHILFSPPMCAGFLNPRPPVCLRFVSSSALAASPRGSSGISPPQLRLLGHTGPRRISTPSPSHLHCPWKATQTTRSDLC